MGIGILDVATAGGKSLIAAGIIKAIDRDTLFLTHKKDYLSEMEYILKSQFTDAMVGRVGGGIVRLSRIDVGSVQTISRNLKELGSYLGKKRVVIVDEAHFACSKSYSDVLAACTHAPWRFGLTASVEKQSVKMVGESQLGPIISTITPKYLIDKGFITPPKIIMFPIKKPKISFRLDYHSCYKEGIVENEFRNNKIVSIAKLLVKRNITPVVILCKMIRHHRNLAECLDYTSLKYEMLDGNHSTVEKDRVFGKLKRGESEVCLFTGIFDESMNVPNLKAVIFAGSGYSQKKSIQRIGRGMRLFKDKPYFVIVDFFDLTHSYLEKHSRIRSRTYKNLGYTSEIGPDINSYLDRWEKLHEKRFI
jgi:superfamily II DNA or RNA helicase